jgi:hypothetical protein
VSIIQTVLVFVGIPAGLFAIIAILVLAPGASRAPRYRPNGGWQYKPVWYLPHPERNEPISALQVPGATEAGNRLAIGDGASVSEPVSASGGASGEW